MEFIDPVVAADELTANSDGKTSQENHNQTEEVVHKLEDEINNAYTLVENNFANLWSNALKNANNLQERYKFEERKKELVEQLNKAKTNLGNKEIVQDNIKNIETQLKDLGEHVKNLETKINYENLSTQANNALDSLDSTLELVEKQAGKYVNQFTSFFSSIVSIDSNDESSNSRNNSETIFSNENYGSSRFDNELFKLHTNEAYFTSPESKEEEEELKNFKSDNKTEEISQLLEKYPNTLTKLMNDLVPVKVSYNLFWYRYFKSEDAMKISDQRRKELLEKNSDPESKSQDKKSTSISTSDAEEEEEFTWDDEDDEDEAVDVAKESASEAKEKKSNSDDNDDDWE